MSGHGVPAIATADLRQIIDLLDSRVLAIAEGIQARQRQVLAALASAGDDHALQRQATCRYVIAAVECAGEAAMMTKMSEGIDALRVDLGKSLQFSTAEFQS